VDVPFARHIGIQYDDAGRPEIAFSPHLQNHLGTMHASAQFALAETASGIYLEALFPELANKVFPVLREGKVKFRQPTETSIAARASVAEAAIAAFREQLTKKGRGTIEVSVEIKDTDDIVTCSCTFKWFVRQLSGEA